MVLRVPAAVALLVLTTIQDPRWAIVYLLVFGVGTIAGPMLITRISVVFGLSVTRQIKFVDGLFMAHAHWTPH